MVAVGDDLGNNGGSRLRTMAGDKVGDNMDNDVDDDNGWVEADDGGVDGGQRKRGC